MKKGDKLLIHCYKHNGEIHRTWDEAIVIKETDEYLVCGNDCVKVTEDDGRSHRTKEPAIMIFYKKHWFNIIAQLKEYGLFYYCNIASPYLIDGNIIKYIDYDLDLRVFPDGGYRVLDKNEYKYHKKIMHYSDDLDLILKNELAILIDMKKKNEGPFDKKFIEEYNIEYLHIKEM
jgi:protein associated with RNAse G/E